MGILTSPEKPGLIPTFCKRINRTSTAEGRWVAAFEERRRTTFCVAKFIYNKQGFKQYLKPYNSVQVNYYLDRKN